MNHTAQIVPPDEEDSTLAKIHFTTVARIFIEVDRALGDALVVNSISSEDFTKLERARERRGRRFRLSLYDPDTQTLIITIPTGQHEVLHAFLYTMEVVASIIFMGLRYNWNILASKTFLPRGSNGGHRGEGDSSGGPFPERSGSRAFPTLIIEAGYSQSLTSLRQKARFWFHISNHDVKIVILAKLSRNRGLLTLEKWEEGPSQSRHGATTTRSVPPLEAFCRQTIIITKIDGDPPTYQVTGGDLVLSFRLLFLRDPRQGERDIVITAQGLEIYADRVWDQLN
ncbi:hypothetical protein V8C34DRAFT_317467 [Trichoderma compactum]